MVANYDNYNCWNEHEASSALPSHLHVGDVLEQKYRLDRILGAGGMGTVVGATHMQLDRRIAIKFMAPALRYNEASVQRFLREARLAARLESDHVVRVFDVAALSDGTPYIVMEYLDGKDLRALLEERGPLPTAEVVDYVVQAAEAVAEAHAAAIVHRDLKPGNLFRCVRSDGTAFIKVLDFGVSKLLPRANATRELMRLTGRDAFVGSPRYAAPEQLQAADTVDSRADIWALGAIVYELAAGVPAFSGETFFEICTQVIHKAPPPLHVVRPEAPAALGAVVARSLAKNPERRHQTVVEFANALAPFASYRSLQTIERIAHVGRRASVARACGVTALTSAPRLRAAADRLTEPPAEQAGTTARKRGRLTLALALVGLLGTAAAALLPLRASILAPHAEAPPLPARAGPPSTSLLAAAPATALGAPRVASPGPPESAPSATPAPGAPPVSSFGGAPSPPAEPPARANASSMPAQPSKVVPARPSRRANETSLFGGLR
jgi:serine/threonine-protein kinase